MKRKQKKWYWSCGFERGHGKDWERCTAHGRGCKTKEAALISARKHWNHSFHRYDNYFYSNEDAFKTQISIWSE